MKKLIALLLALVMVLSLLAACSTPDEPSQQPSTEDVPNSSSENNEDEEFSYPVQSDVELTMYRGQNALIKANYDGFGDSEVAKALEAASGIKVKYEDTYADQEAYWNQMLADGTYTDMISFNAMTYAGGPLAAMQDGLAIELNDIIDQYMPNFKAYLQANPSVDKAIKTDDGIYYMIPYVNSNTGAYSYGAYYREDMLQELGAKEPTTVDEWHDLLVQVKEKYGITPISCEWSGLIQYGMFAMAFGVGGNSTSNHFAIDGEGKVYYQRNDENWKSFLETMHAWFDEGLIDPDVASIASGDVRAKMISGDAFLSMGWLGSAMQVVQQQGAAANEKFQLKAVGTPALKAGEPIEWVYATTLVSGMGTTISSQCENVELAARYLDFLFSEQGHLIANYGVEGVSYTMVDNIPTFKDEIVKSGSLPAGMSQSQSAARYSAATTGIMAMVKDDYYYEQLMDEKCCADAIYIWMNSAVGGGHMHELPGLSYNEEESGAIGTIVTNLKTLSDENALKFVLGTRDLAEWDAYVQEISNMGVDAALVIMNQAMARYQSR